MTRVPQAFKELRTRDLECRMLAHAWTHQITFVVQGGHELHFECMRCKTTRIDTYTTQGQLDARSYIHAKGYLIEDLSSWGGRKTFNQNVRRELISRLSVNAKRRPDQKQRRSA